MARSTPKSIAPKRLVAEELSVARSSLYYRKKIPERDQVILAEIKETLKLYPSYGYRRLSLHLKRNKKQVQRVMRVANLKPYRRRGKRPAYLKNVTTALFPNLVRGWFPDRKGLAWISDFTYLPFNGKFVFLATILDLYSREVIGWHVSTSHDTALTSAALFHALTFHTAPQILHSDQGVEYKAKSYVELAEQFGIHISMSRKASPWENGYQESFYSQFKVDLGDPGRFSTLGELTEYLHLKIHIYNRFRIHSAHKTSPQNFIRNENLNHQMALAA